MIRKYFEYLILNFPIFIFLIVLGETTGRVLPVILLVFLMQLITYIGLIIRNKVLSIFATLINLIVVFAFMLFSEGLENAFLIPLILAVMLALFTLSTLLKYKYTSYLFVLVIGLSVGLAFYMKIDFLNITVKSILFYEVLACVGILICNSYGCAEKHAEKPKIRLKTDN